MDDTFLKANITISALEDTGSQLKIKDENRKTYSFFKKKKDGDPTQAFSQFSLLKVGERTGISYKEVPYKDGTIKNITSFTPVFDQIGQPAPQSKPVQKQTYVKEPVSEEKDEKFWDKKAYKQCLWNFWLERYEVPVARQSVNLAERDMDLVWTVFNQIEKDADKRFSTGWDKARAIFEEPLPEPPAEVNVEDIPF